MGNRKLSWPLEKVHITQAFGQNPAMYRKYNMLGHDGIDLRTAFADTPKGHMYVKAPADGWVEELRSDEKGYGLHFRLRMDDPTLLPSINGIFVIGGHMSKVYTAKGKRFKRGQIIGLTGNTGASTGPHYHHETRPTWAKPTNGYAGAVDPMQFMEPVKFC